MDKIYLEVKRETGKQQGRLKSYLWLNELSFHQALKLQLFLNQHPDPLGCILSFPELLSLLSGRAGRDAKKKEEKDAIIQEMKINQLWGSICCFPFKVTTVTILTFYLIISYDDKHLYKINHITHYNQLSCKAK